MFLQPVRFGSPRQRQPGACPPAQSPALIAWAASANAATEALLIAKPRTLTSPV
ncbi:hypothetical protein ABQE69_11205 [Mycolicibacillus trivialis]